MSSTANANHACDACRRRKIRCDRNQPCSCCLSASLSCTFLAPTRAKGRQGRTANIISALRSSQIQNIQGSINGNHAIAQQNLRNSQSQYSQSQQQVNDDLPAAPTQRNGNNNSVRTEGLLTLETFHACREFYFSQFHASVPIVEESLLHFSGGLMDISNDLYTLTIAFSAFIILQTGAVHHAPSTSSSLLSEDIGYGQSLLQEALSARRNGESAIVRPSVQNVVTSFLLYACFRFLNEEREAWFFLREATTLFVDGMGEEAVGVGGGDVDMDGNGSGKGEDLKGSVEAAQLFWLLLVTERAYAIRKHKPLTLLISPTTPKSTSLPPHLTTSGFTHLLTLYRPFDEIFLGSWNSTSFSTTLPSLLHLETHLQKTVSVSIPLSEIQLADLLVSQQWLRMIVWQLATKLGFLSSASKHESLTFRYPINIARDLVISTFAILPQSLEIHGIGLVEKLFDICYQLIDVMAFTPSPTTTPTTTPFTSTAPFTTPEPSSAMELGASDYLSHLFNLISRLRGSGDRFLPLLQRKLEVTLPGLGNPLGMQLRSFELGGGLSPEVLGAEESEME